MKRLLLLALLLIEVALFATNGDSLIGVGPTSRAMGGVGISSAQDSISAIFSNPATLWQIEGNEFDFSGTYFSPTVKAKVNVPVIGLVWKGESQDKGFSIPAIGLSYKMNESWTFGIGAYGVSGMGVDYRNIDPFETNTKVSVMKFVPAFAYKKGSFSYGLGLDIDYQAADFGQGTSHNYAFGARLGMNYNYKKFNFGLVYVTPQNVKHNRIYDFNGDSIYDNIKLENPAQYGIGISQKFGDSLLLAFEIKYLDWNSADGYKDFDWDSQWVYAVGMCYKISERVKLRVGYNYAKNPVNEHNYFNFMGLTNVQGNYLPTFGYEYFRIIGFPAIVESHVTCGMSYSINNNVNINLGYKHAFSKTIKENFLLGSLESKLSEDAFDFGLSFKF